MTVLLSQPEERRGARDATPAVPRPAVVTSQRFADFYRAHWSDLAGFCAALIGSTTIGDDIAQEAFARLYARFAAVRDPRPYVFRIAANLVKAHRRAHQETPLEHAPDSVAPATGIDVEVLDAVRRLPERVRVVVLLHYYADLPVDEVARVLRRPAGSVKRQLSEARAQLALSLGESP